MARAATAVSWLRVVGERWSVMREHGCVHVVLSACPQSERPVCARVCGAQQCCVRVAGVHALAQACARVLARCHRPCPLAAATSVKILTSGRVHQQAVTSLRCSPRACDVGSVRAHVASLGVCWWPADARSRLCACVCACVVQCGRHVNQCGCWCVTEQATCAALNSWARGALRPYQRVPRNQLAAGCAPAAARTATGCLHGLLVHGGTDRSYALAPRAADTWSALIPHAPACDVPLLGCSALAFMQLCCPAQATSPPPPL
jgi:hypothetical protein